MTTLPPSFSFKKSADKDCDTAIGFVFKGNILSAALEEINKNVDGLLSHVLDGAKSFEAKPGQTKLVPLPESGGFRQVLLVGAGDPEETKALNAETMGGKTAIALKAAKAEKACVLSPSCAPFSAINEATFTAHFLHGMELRSYHFEKYKSEDEDDEPAAKLSHIHVASDNASTVEKAFTPLNETAKGIYLARDLVNEPPNALHPETYAQIIKDQLKPLGVEVEIFDEKKLQKMGAGAILAVGMGSLFPPRMVVMKWNGGKKGDTPLGLVGKGVTFDTGGISLKPGAGMDEMKMDMAGSAAVVGVMKSLALKKTKANVVGIVGLAENAVSERAYRPGDIITSLSGKTIEVLNTDAEGRLVLGDCLSYMQKTYSPNTIINLATLTGAMMVALGHEYCGTFATHDALWEKLEDSSAETGEKLWRMPLDEVWKKDMVSNVADIQNMAKSGRFAGACTAAGFLQHFIESEDTHWAHMDIAGTAWSKKDKPTVPKYGSGFGVRVLDAMIEKYYT